MVALQYTRIIEDIENDEDYERVIDQIYELQISEDFDLRNKADQDKLFNLLEKCRMYELLHSLPPNFEMEVSIVEEGEDSETDDESRGSEKESEIPDD